MILSKIQKHPSLAFFIAARHFACTYNLQVDFFSPQQFSWGQKGIKEMASWRHVCWWEDGGPWLRNWLNWTVSWPWLCFSCSSICTTTWQLISSLWIAERSWAMKTDIHRYAPWGEHSREEQGYPLFWKRNKIKKILIFFTSLQISSPCWRSFPCLPSYCSP